MTCPMRGAAAIAAAVTAMLLLAACSAASQLGTSSAPHDSPATNEPATHAPATPASATHAPAVNRIPQPATTPPRLVDTSVIRMPLALEDATVMDPGWTVRPLALDGVLVAAGHTDAGWEFTAVTTAGESLWTVQRPPGAGGFAVTRTSLGQAVAVLTDLTGPSQSPTASAYDLTTGELVWGPIDVPGPLVGPGVVFAESAHSGSADPAPRVALDPTTGAVLTWGSEGSERVLGEFLGHVLLDSDGILLLRDAAGGETLWSIAEVSSLSNAVVATDQPPHHGLVLLNVSQNQRAVLSLDTGRILADDALDAVVDPTTSTLVISHRDGVRAMDLEGTPLWAHPTEDHPVLHSAYGALVYTQDKDVMRVHNAVTGAIAVAYQDSGSAIAVPAQFFPAGGAVIYVNGHPLLATSG